jgi:hypothetical protein
MLWKGRNALEKNRFQELVKPKSMSLKAIARNFRWIDPTVEPARSRYTR